MTDGPDLDATHPHVEHLPVLGVPTTFATDDRTALEAVIAAYGRWARYADLADRDRLASPSGPAHSPCVVRISVRRAERVPAPGDGGMHRLLDRTRLVVEARGVAGEADAARGESRVVVDPDVVADRERFVHDVLDPLTLFLIGHRDRQPVHAAAIARDGAAILLAGPSGAGKSTLAYAASRHGFSVLADEPVYVQLEPRLRVWGRRARLHLQPDVRARFPELSGIEPVRLSTGKTKLVVDTAEGPRCAERAALCLLRRSETGRVGLERVEPALAVAELTTQLDPGFDLFAESIPERIARVAAGGAWALSLSDDPRDALPLLEEVAAQVEGER